MCKLCKCLIRITVKARIEKFSASMQSKLKTRRRRLRRCARSERSRKGENFHLTLSGHRALVQADEHLMNYLRLISSQTVCTVESLISECRLFIYATIRSSTANQTNQQCVNKQSLVFFALRPLFRFISFSAINSSHETAIPRLKSLKAISQRRWKT